VPRGPWAALGDNNTFVMNERKAQRQLVEAKQKTEAVVR
jgi:hypothetical protein